MLLEVRVAELERLGRLGEALAKAKALTQLAPRHAEGHARRGALHAARGERDEAREAFLRALMIDRDNRRARRGLLKLDFGRGQRGGPGADASAHGPGA